MATRQGFRCYGTLGMLAIAVATFFALAAWTAPAAGDDDDGDFCSATAALLFRACENEVKDDFFVGQAICTNVSDADARKECLAEADAQRTEGNQLCDEQLDGRSAACRSLGEDRYDPDFDPAHFDHDFARLTRPNPYFPLRIGNRWEYRGGDEVNTVEVTEATKRIDGVTCIVVRDLVEKEGDLVEATDDWYAQAKDGNTWYCGEEVKDFESFDGDDPRVPELVSNAGSFKAGRDGDKPGIIFQAHPARGQVYLEEFSLGNAEDVTEILSTTYAYGRDRDLDRFVPRQLAQRLCSGNCVVTRNFSLLEPGVSARKYYARGIGFFLEVQPADGEVLQLVNCNFDSRCGTLPRP